MLRCAAALFVALALAACGGGGDAPEQRVQTAHVVSTCPVEPAANGQQVGRVLVQTDSYTFPTSPALEDRKFSTATFTNAAATAVSVQVQVSAQRTLATSASAGGGMRFFVGVLDTTANQLVANDCADDIVGQTAGTQLTMTENRVYTLSVPAGHTFVFTPFARAIPASQPPSNDPFVLTTANFDLRLVQL